VTSIADIVRRHGADYIGRFGGRMPPSHLRALADIASCGTPSRGGHLLKCDDCGRREFIYLSCRNRACPRCHARQTAEWTAARTGELLPVRYHHMVATLPAELREPARHSQKIFLAELMEAAAEAVQDLALDSRFAGGKLAVLTVLHTNTRALVWHPHVHLLVPGIAVDTTGGVHRMAPRFLLPVRRLSGIFRAKLAERIRRRLPNFEFPGAVWRKKWVVFSRPCIEGNQPVLKYLARYVCRGPLSDYAILSAGDNHVTFRYTDNKTGESRILTLPPAEFLRRYLQHTLPRGFHRVRYYGLWAPANRKVLRTLQLALAASRPPPRTEEVPAQQPQKQGPRPCPNCGSVHMSVIGRLQPLALLWQPLNRGPPA
jgi:hypothetical protein